jgi:hypothetical protein
LSRGARVATLERKLVAVAGGHLDRGEYNLYSTESKWYVRSVIG